MDLCQMGGKMEVDEFEANSRKKSGRKSRDESGTEREVRLAGMKSIGDQY